MRIGAHIRCVLGKVCGRRPSPSRPLNTVEDFFDRHLDQIAEKINSPVVHYPHCCHGKRMWMFTWKWPFIQTWISTAVCCCEINRLMDEIVVALSSKPHGYDLYRNFPQKPGCCSSAADQADEDEVKAEE